MRARPPRINKISSVLDKLWKFAEKLEDLGHKIQVSSRPNRTASAGVPILTVRAQTFHDHLDVLNLHSQLQSLHITAAEELEAERARRRTFEEHRAQARAHRREVREEIRRAKEAAQARRDRQGSHTRKAHSVGGYQTGAGV